MLRKIAVILIAVCMFAVKTYASYPYSSVCPSPAGGRYSQDDVDQWSFYKCECTSYTAYRINEVAPIGFSNSYRLSSGDGWHDGNDWSGAADRAGISRSNKPLPGDVAYWNYGTWGHVAFVESVEYDDNGNATSIFITEYNYPSGFSPNSRSISPTNPDGYIHFLNHEYNGVACASHSNGRELCWSYDGSISCSSGEGHFYNDRDDGICYLASSSDCTGVTGTSKYVGGRGGGVIGILTGPGYDTPPTDTPDPGLPDFKAVTIELSDYNPHIWDAIKVRAKFENVGDDDISSDDKIESRFYLSKGYKEDSHSEWIRIGKEETKGSNLDPGESHWEEEDLKLWEYPGIIEPGKPANLVACIDRTEDNDNGDGEYPEIHKSNNCTTEAVFTVQEEVPPAPTTKFIWSSAGAVSGYQCTQITEPSDPHTWNDNYFCSDQDYGIAWSNAGAIGGMRCTWIYESADPDGWDNNYLCVPTTSNLYFSWSSAGPIMYESCVRWVESSDPDTWNDNYLCYRDETPPPPPAEYNLEVATISKTLTNSVNLWPGEDFVISSTIHNSGDDILSAVYVGYYFDDVLVDSYTISASDLEAGEFFSDSVEIDTQESIDPGGHSAKVCIDYNNQLAEIDEQDNCQSIGVWIKEPINPAVMMMFF